MYAYVNNIRLWNYHVKYWHACVSFIPTNVHLTCIWSLNRQSWKSDRRSWKSGRDTSKADSFCVKLGSLSQKSGRDTSKADSFCVILGSLLQKSGRDTSKANSLHVKLGSVLRNSGVQRTLLQRSSLFRHLFYFTRMCVLFKQHAVHGKQKRGTQTRMRTNNHACV